MRMTRLILLLLTTSTFVSAFRPNFRGRHIRRNTIFRTRRRPGSPSSLFSSDETLNKDRESRQDDSDRSLVAKVQDFLKNKENQEELQSYAASLAVALLVRFFIVEPRYIPSLSMYPTFNIGDQLAVDKISKIYRPFARKDVVVFNPPQAFKDISGISNDEALIKRVIAVAGDTVQMKKGILYVNGEAQRDSFTNEPAYYDWGPQTVPSGMLMVLGDNRNHSLDSHIWGFLPKENVIGRAIFKYWPIWRLGAIETD